MGNKIEKFINKEGDIRNYLLGFRILKFLVVILILIKSISYLLHPYLLATPNGISIYNGFLQKFYEIRYFPQVVLSFTIFLALFSLFGKGNIWVGFLLFFGVYITENVCFLCNHGMDNHLKMMVFFLIPLTSVSVFQTKIEQVNLWQKLGFLSVKFHLCLVYLASVLGKLIDPIWINGMANSYILSMDRFSYFAINDWIANSYFLTKFTTYFTLIFELLFPVLIWIKRTKKWMIISGVLFHIVLLIIFMLLQFEALYIAMILCFVNTSSKNSMRRI